MQPTYDQTRHRPLSRRAALKLGALGLATAALSPVGIAEALPYKRGAPVAVPPTLPDIQFDIDPYIGPAVTVDGLSFRFGPLYTKFVTFKLDDKYRFQHKDQRDLAAALDTIEVTYPFSPSGLFLFVAYGLPYFNQVPGGLSGPLVAQHMPRLLADQARYALEEAIPGPSDVSPQNPGVRKATFNVPVRITSYHLLLTLRSDNLAIIDDVVAWLRGSDTLNGSRVKSPHFKHVIQFVDERLMVAQRGWPRRQADSLGLPYASYINPDSPMWMGYADQQLGAAGPAAITTFAGNSSARLTTAQVGDYFAAGSIQHLSRVILDLGQYYAADEPYRERVQYMFRSDPPPAPGYGDQYTDGGGTAYVANVFAGPADAARSAQGIGVPGNEHRIGHVAALQRSSRAADGTPLHIRLDGPGFDSVDVPDGTAQPKLQFSILVPTADVFATMRRHQAAQDLVQRYGVNPADNGLERFITTTQRQNFLLPPRAHRAFPLLELM